MARLIAHLHSIKKEHVIWVGVVLILDNSLDLITLLTN